jgi:hypothetical protein
MSFESAHWYTRDGKPQHTQPTTSAKAKNATRPTRLADAIKNKLLPSVSGITKMLSAPVLEVHKMRKLAECCFNNPAHPGEDMKGYISAMIDKSGDDAGTAASLGTLIHKAIEDYFEYGQYENQSVELSTGACCLISEMVGPAIDKWNSIGVQVTYAEKVLVSGAYGFAGTTDIIWGGNNNYGVLDWKSKRTTKDEAVEPIDTHVMQIAAYIAAHWSERDSAIPFGQHAKGYNMYISTTEPGRVDLVEYNYDRLINAWDDFNCLCTLWRSRNEYDPRF